MCFCRWAMSRRPSGCIAPPFRDVENPAGISGEAFFVLLEDFKETANLQRSLMNTRPATGDNCHFPQEVLEHLISRIDARLSVPPQFVEHAFPLGLDGFGSFRRSRLLARWFLRRSIRFKRLLILLDLLL